MGQYGVSFSSKLVLVSDPRAANFGHRGLKDAPFLLFIPWSPGQAWHIVGFQKSGHGTDKGTATVTKTGSSTQSHKENGNVPNRLHLACS